MQSLHFSTPSGRGRNPTGGRRRTSAHWEAQDRAAGFAGLPPGAGRFDIVNLLRREGVAAAAGWRRGLVEHLALLVRHTYDGDWLSGGRPVVWLSVRAAAEALGISECQVRRNERALMELGAIAWRDAANYRRYGWRDADGRIAQAFGLDLSPAAALLDRIAALDAQLAAERAERRKLRAELAAARRHARDGLLQAVSDGLIDGAAAEALVEEIRAGALRSDTAPLDAMRGRIAAAERILGLLRSLADGSEPPAGTGRGEGPEGGREGRPGNRLRPDMHAKADGYACPGMHPCEPPLQTTNQTLPEGNTVAGTATPEGKRVVAAVAPSVPARRMSRAPSAPPDPVGQGGGEPPLEALLEALPPEVAAAMPADGGGLRELVDASAAAAGRLGISPSAWAEACRTLGRTGAALAVAVIAAHRDAGRIRSPGGYLRAMTRRAGTGDLHLAPSLWALVDRALPGRRGRP